MGVGVEVGVGVEQGVVDLPPLGVEWPRRVGTRHHRRRLVGEHDVAASGLGGVRA